MNAAFLLVTAAWLAGADADAAPPAAAPAAAAATGGSCCGDCAPCCESERRGLLARLRDRFRKDCCDDCCPKCEPAKCCEPKPCCKPACEKKCDACDCGCERRGLLTRLRDRFRKNDCCDDCCPAPKCEPKCCEHKCAKASCGTCADACDDCCRETLRDRLRRWFRKNDCCDACDSCGCGAAAAPAVKPEAIPAPKGEPAKKLPEGAKPASISEPELNKATMSVETETQRPFELSRRYESRVAHAPDYSWLTGQLFYVHADGGLWLLRYASLDKEDRYGGSIVLARDLRMDEYQEGDLVTVHGEILSQKSSMFLGGPLYRAQSIQLVERASK